MPAIDSFPKIDAHVHYNADRPNLLEMARRFNFSLVSINTEVPDFPSIEKQRQLAQSHSAESDIPLHYATTVSSEHIFSDGWAKSAITKIKNDRAEGAIGVKFWKNIGMSIRRTDGSFLMPDDPELEPVFSFLEEEQIPVLGHQGEPKNCWLPVEEMTVKSDREYFSAHPEYHMYKHDEYPGYRDHIEARDAVLDRHPNLRFVGLHLASLEWNLDKVEQRLERYPNLAVDLAERITHLYYHAAENRQSVIDFFEKYQDRIIYGTDIINDPGQPAKTINEELERRWTAHWEFLTTDRPMESEQVRKSFQGLALPEAILEKIYRLNAEKWYQLE
ncbi:amidohydrolase [Aliifodinibius salicampi]|uniref:Amidohydrolase n=1 Tax=Fodinibius salicampi TaxID=1920655 RepID=A0ABT3PZU3_9BACT|nr:amidohydrolase family protein [Fodinibius salicampi]MCW9713370.1 amidohydrolase [Fodinibius salicampi]